METIIIWKHWVNFHRDLWVTGIPVYTYWYWYFCVYLYIVGLRFVKVLLVLLSDWLPSVHWHCWLGGRKGIRPAACKKWGDGGGGHWLIRMEWRPAGWSVCLPLLIFPCTIKSRSSLLAPASPGWSWKKGFKDDMQRFFTKLMQKSFLAAYCNINPSV